MKKKVILVIVMVAIIIPIAFWGASLIKCEILTQKYYNDFEQAINKIQYSEKWNISKY